MDHDKIVVAMEHCPGGQLLKWDVDKNVFIPDPKRVEADGLLPEDLIRRVLWQTAQGINFLHEHGVIHRDIKPQNIMFGEFG